MVDYVGGAGSDNYTGGAGADLIYGEGGDDNLSGEGGDDRIFGGAGNDGLRGGDGNDELNGGEGDDYIVGGAGNDTIDGGPGANDIAAFNLPAGTTGSYRVVEGTGVNAGKLLVERVNGNVVDTVFIVTINSGQATVQGVGIAAHLGTDVVTNVEQLHFLPEGPFDASTFVGINLSAVQFGEFVSGSAGSDTIDLGDFPGAINADGGLGDDEITGTEASNYLGGGLGDDTLYGLGGSDNLEGGEGNDVLEGGDGNDALTGGAGDDLLNGGAGDDTVSANQGDDTIDGGDGNDYLRGEAGNDTIDGGTGSNDIAAFFLPAGTTGSYRVVAGTGVNAGSLIVERVDGEVVETVFIVTINGGQATVQGVGLAAHLGTDVVTNVEQLHFLPEGPFDPATFVAINLSPVQSGNFVAGSAGADTINLVDYPGAINADGGAGDDEITGTEVNNDLSGGDGDDSLIGLAGSDYLRGGDGNDLIHGGDEVGNFGDGVDGGAGDDEIHGGASNDSLAGGDGADTIYGGDGNDRISGSGSGLSIFPGFSGGVAVRSFGINDAARDDGQGDSLFGGAGDDSITVSVGDSADGGDGADQLIAIFSTWNAGLTLDLTADAQSTLGNLLGGSFTNFETYGVVGTAFADSLTGSVGNDQLDGDAGDDTIHGGDGADGLFGGLGADILNGGAGNDTITAGRYAFFSLIGGVSGARLDDGAVDTVSGGDGDDTATLGFGDNFDGGAGIDRIIVSLAGRTSGVNLDLTTDAVARVAAAANASYVDVEFLSNSLGLTEFDDELIWTGITGGNTTGSGNLYGHGGDDRIISDVGNQFVGGNQGDDYLDTGIGNDRLWGGSGNDTLLGGDGVDILYGDEDNDNALNGVLPAGNDVLNGGAGNDELWGGGGSDNLTGGDGNDLIRGDAHTYAVNFGRPDLAPFVVEGDDVIDGGLGDDNIFGDGGNDILTGGLGNDRLDGGAGIDTVSYAYLSNGFFLNLSIQGVGQSVAGETDTLIGIENAIGTAFNDNIRGNEGANVIQLGAGNDLSYGGLGADTLDGGEGNDSLWHGANINMLTGQQIDPVTGAILGLAHDDGSVDNLIGGGGNDVLYVGLGDTASGGEGHDRLFLSFFAHGSALNLDLSSGDAATILADLSGGSYSGFEEYAVFGTLFDDTVRGTAGSDRIYDNFGFNTFYGGDGDDFLSGGFDGSNLYGEGGNDILYNGAGVDGLYGGDGDDRIIYGSSLGPVLDPPVAADDIIAGGAGRDLVDFGNAAPVDGQGLRVDLSITTAQNINFGQVQITGVEDLSGSAFADTFTGDGRDNVLSDTRGGDDRFTGGAGNDTLTIQRFGTGVATTISLTGGDGNDALIFNGNGRFTDTVIFEGEDGADVVTTAGALFSDINLGRGSDRVTVDTLGGSWAIRLGTGSDTVVLADTGGGFAAGAANVVRDFSTGDGGDVLDLTAWLAGGALTNFTPGSNPLQTGHMRLFQDGDDTLVQVDRDGGGDSFVTLLTLQNTRVADFTAANFNGLVPLPAPVEGGEGADSLTGTSGIDVLNGNGGNDNLFGGDGDDVLSGGAGDDYITGAAGDDTIDGGTGTNDIAAFNLPAGTTGSYRVVEGTGENAGRLIVERVDGEIVETVFIVTINGGQATVQGVGIAAHLGTDVVTNVDQLHFLPEGPFDPSMFVGINLSASQFGDFVSGSVSADTIDLADYPGAINADGGRGDDVITGTEVNNDLSGGDGDDSLTGGDGNDYLRGGAGNDAIDGGPGSDTVAFNLPAGTTGSYRVVDGTGENAGRLIVERVDGETVETVFIVTLDGSQATVEGVGLAAHLGTDVVTNVEQLHFLPEGPFDPSMFVGINLSVRQFDTSVSGSVGADTINFADYPGVINGDGDRGNDVITGTEVNNFIGGGLGDDVLHGLGGADTLIGGGGVDTLSGGDDNDLLIGGFNSGGALQPGDGADTLRGEGGNDIIRGADGDDLIEGGDGNDNIRGDAGSDTLDGGAGDDFAIYLFNHLTAGVTFDARAVDAAVSSEVVDPLGGTDTLISIERLGIAGSQFNDIIYGGENLDAEVGFANQIYGNSGNDRIYGGSGNDLLNGGAGNDVMVGGDGVDVADYSDAASGVSVRLALTTSQNTGGSGRDTLTGIENLFGSAFGDSFTGDAGDNVLTDLQGGNDRFIGGAGNDTLTVERSGDGAATSISLTGGIGNDAMTFDGNGRYTDTVTFVGEDGDDVVTTAGALYSNITTGAGNDTVTVDTLGGTWAVRLGSGVDTLVLAGTEGGFEAGLANVVRDFATGNGGDVIDLTAWLAGGALTNFTGGDNPFLSGHMRLVQSGRDTLLQVDRNGGGDGFVTLLTLQKTLVANFTAFNFNGLSPLPAPIEGGAGADALTGTDGIDVLNGNGGDDRLAGGAGNDTLNGGAGNDVLDGGAGDDVLNGGSGGQGDTATYASASAGVNVSLAISGLQNTGGSGFDSLTGIEHLIGSAFTDELRGDGFNNRLTDTLGGNDFLRGEGGNDTILITRAGGGAATTVRLNGGDGDDALTFAGNGRFSDIVTLEGNVGQDVITVSGGGTISIDAGAGDDTVIYDTLGGVHRMTLGTGVDTVRLADTGGLFQASSGNLVRDFTTGAGGDIIDLSAYLAGGALTNYTGGDNPFGDGHMRLVQNGTRTLLQVDRDGGGNGYQTVLTFANTTVASFTAANFNGIDPTGVAPMPLQTGDKDADAGPQVLPGLADDDFLVLPAAQKLDLDGPQVLPGETADGLTGGLVDRAGLFEFSLDGSFALTLRTDGLTLDSPDHGAPGHDGWLV